VAHDFNNLLMVINASAATLGQASDPRDAAARADIELAVEQASGLTRSLLAYARREAIVPVLLSVDDHVTSALPIVRQILGTSIELSLSLGAGEGRIVIDSTQLRQVLLNLVGNASDATRGHGGQVRISTNLVVLEPDEARSHGVMTEGTFLVLAVADDGRGMAKDLQERAFDPFFTTKGQGEGTGLGLSMCESIVRRAGGFISIDSIPGEGATLRVYLPVARTEKTSAHDRTHESARPTT
jgi:signal transduction histidine kinase